MDPPIAPGLLQIQKFESSNYVKGNPVSLSL